MYSKHSRRGNRSIEADTITCNKLVVAAGEQSATGRVRPTLEELGLLTYTSSVTSIAETNTASERIITASISLANGVTDVYLTLNHGTAHAYICETFGKGYDPDSTNVISETEYINVAKSTEGNQVTILYESNFKSQTNGSVMYYQTVNGTLLSWGADTSGAAAGTLVGTMVLRITNETLRVV